MAEVVASALELRPVRYGRLAKERHKNGLVRNSEETNQALFDYAIAERIKRNSQICKRPVQRAYEISSNLRFCVLIHFCGANLPVSKKLRARWRNAAVGSGWLVSLRYFRGQVPTSSAGWSCDVSELAGLPLRSRDRPRLQPSRRGKTRNKIAEL